MPAFQAKASAGYQRGRTTMDEAQSAEWAVSSMTEQGHTGGFTLVTQVGSHWLYTPGLSWGGDWAPPLLPAGCRSSSTSMTSISIRISISSFESIRLSIFSLFCAVF